MKTNQKFKPWRDAVEKAIAEAKDEILTWFEVRQHLEKLVTMEASPIEGIQIVIGQSDTRHDTKPIGRTNGRKLSAQNDPLTEDASASGNMEVTAWAEETASISTGQWYTSIQELVRETWLPELRVRGQGLLDFQSDKVTSRLPSTVARLASKFGTDDLYVVYTDLDRFKRINDEVSHSAGNKAIAYTARCIEEIAEEIPLLGFRDGGDEFYMIVAGTPLPKIMQLVARLFQQIESQEYGEQKLTIGCTAGIALLEDFDTFESIKTAFAAAEDAVFPPGQKGTEHKKRGTMSIANSTQYPSDVLPFKTFSRLATVLARTFQGNDKPFANLLLNVLSSIASTTVRNGQIDQTAVADVDKAVKWLGITPVDALHEWSLIGKSNAVSAVPRVALAMAVFHGMAKALAEQSGNAPGAAVKFYLRASATGSHVALLANGELVWGRASDSYDEMELGTPIIGEQYPPAFSTTVAFQVGFPRLMVSPNGNNLPASLFSDTIIVDDRPKTGGGLPDFWQAGVANIISAIGNNINFKTLLVVGDVNHAPETIKRIKGETPLDGDELSVVTALKRAVVDESINLLKKADTIQFKNGFEEIVETLYMTSLQLTSWTSQTVHQRSEKAPKLKRSLDVTKLKLSALDGVRCETAAQAYPLIVEVLRTSDAVSITYDDASQPLGEIVGFKLALEEPIKDPIPDYWADEENEFEEYARDVLINEHGYISRHFHEDGQFGAFVAQLVDYCSPENSKKSTRRAILVVKNNAENGILRPLGLVSIWATPRHHAGSCHIEFCFVWRTVEALVGLPYSLFGSIKFSEHVITEVKKVLVAKGSNVRLGKLTYLALSLHMRDDEFHRRIAKRIADAASV